MAKELPTNCYDCEFCEYKGRNFPGCGLTNDGSHMMIILFRAKTEVRTWCPLYHNGKGITIQAYEQHRARIEEYLEGQK